MISYRDLVNSFANDPRDVSTRPLINKAGKWFFVYAENGKLVVDTARAHEPKCSISNPRVLPEKEIDEIFELYIKRKQGYSVSKQATEITRNQVYWYGIFDDMGL